MKNITIILPVHKLNDEYNEMLLNAVESAKEFYNDVKLLIVAPETLKKELNKIDLGQKLEVSYEFHNSESDFCTQINKAASVCDTEWFSILEIDDQYQKNWLKSMNQYMSEHADADVLLPIIKDINTEGELTNYTNESVWAYGFSEVQGVLNNEVLMEYQNYQISGGLFKTKTFLDNGGLKNNIKLTFGYELLLRLTHNGVKIVVVPKIGYKHVNLREDSLFWLYKNDEATMLKENEAKFWVEAAKKEFFFNNKRDVNYTEA
jgi:predicted Fe-Mo cluster-binding NifX family protein